MLKRLASKPLNHGEVETGLFSLYSSLGRGGSSSSSRHLRGYEH